MTFIAKGKGHQYGRPTSNNPQNTLKLNQSPDSTFGKTQKDYHLQFSLFANSINRDTQRLNDALVCRAAIIKYHRMGGLKNRYFSQFWKLQVQAQGMIRFGFFRGLLPQLENGCLLCPHEMPLSPCRQISCASLSTKTPVTLD